ncbi:hypothetical protein C8R43DRAFT_1142383 [Mycena crocata]|nr:hypothetical protein C8R43DRAFT_1142383 [Mycena crocata]
MDSPHKNPQTSSAPLRAHLAQIDAEISELQSKLSHLAAARKTIIQGLESMSYPVHTLPHDVLAEIFMRYVEDEFLASPGRGPLLLASICRSWRFIALEVQPLWSRISIPPTFATIPTAGNLLQWWLQRTGGHALEIDATSIIGADCAHLLSAIGPHSAQLRTFGCTLPLIPSHHIGGCLPMLRKLTLVLGSSLDDVPTPIAAFTDAPQLCEVHLLYISFSEISLPWGQLTSLECQGQTTAQCMEILHHTPQLETLSLKLAMHDEDHSESEPLLLDRLHTLEFQESFQGNLKHLDFLALPALKHLNVGLFGPVVLPSLVAFLTRSQCSLSTISFGSTRISHPLISALEALATVQEVCITDAPNITVYRLFEAIADNPKFIPNLRRLSVERCTGRPEMTYAGILDMLKTRCAAPVRLKSFRLTYEEQQPRADWADALYQMRRLAEAGCEIDFPGIESAT